MSTYDYSMFMYRSGVQIGVEQQSVPVGVVYPCRNGVLVEDEYP